MANMITIWPFWLSGKSPIIFTRVHSSPTLCLLGHSCPDRAVGGAGLASAAYMAWSINLREYLDPRQPGGMWRLLFLVLALLNLKSLPFGWHVRSPTSSAGFGGLGGQADDRSSTGCLKVFSSTVASRRSVGRRPSGPMRSSNP